MIKLTNEQAKQIANILEETMTNAGIMDDIGELIGGMIEYNVSDDEIMEWGESVDTCISFINKVLKKEGNNFIEPFGVESVKKYSKEDSDEDFDEESDEEFEE